MPVILPSMGSRAGTAERTRTVSPLTIDLVFYACCLAYAVATAVGSEFYGFRIWGEWAALGYGLAAVCTCLLFTRRGSRWPGVAAIGVFAMVVPLAVLVVRRLTGVDWLVTPFSWSAQPEVWVIERSARLLLAHGTPYVEVTTLGRPPVVNDYTPYGPVMTVFGLPRALFGGTPVTDALTDARLIFALTAIACVWFTLKLLGFPRIPVRAAQVAVACPLTALTWAVAGPDLAILGLLLVAGALAARDRPVAAAIVLALAVNAKLIVLPAVVVLAALVFARLGWRAAGVFAATGATATAVVTLPVLLVDPRAFVEHVLLFPAGLGQVSSPAASPLPGHLIASAGTAGRVTAFVLLGAAAVAIMLWLARRPPVTGADAMLRIAVALGAFTLLTPATRFGYLVYPLVLIGATLCFGGTGKLTSSSHE